jgi:hypothetical protein
MADSPQIKIVMPETCDGGGWGCRVGYSAESLKSSGPRSVQSASWRECNRGKVMVGRPWEAEEEDFIQNRTREARSPTRLDQHAVAQRRLKPVSRRDPRSGGGEEDEEEEEEEDRVWVSLSD